MSAKDFFHEHVKAALIKDGWTITHDPLEVTFGDEKALMDLGAEKLIAAEKDREKIVVEIKSFLEPSYFHSFHQAVGQFINYRVLLNLATESRELFLAVPKDFYDNFLTRAFGQAVIKEEEINILVFEPEKKEILLWIK